MITDDDVKKLKKVFATKEDLKRFATKEDFQKLREVDANLVREVVEIKAEIADIKEKMATKDELRQVMTTVDAVFGEVKAMREEQAAHFQSHEDNNQEHGEFRRRLDKIESVPVIAHQVKT